MSSAELELSGIDVLPDHVGDDVHHGVVAADDA